MAQITHLGTVKKIINGKAYNTDTSTLIYAGCPDDKTSDAFWALYQTRQGEFFVWWNGHDPELDHGFGPITDKEAKVWLETHANHLTEQYFGSCLEGGAAERRLTVRLPANLAARIEAAAQAEGLSLNSYAMRCFEKCAQDLGRKPEQNN